MGQPTRINPEEALREIREAGERRSNPVVDLSRINEYKQLFVMCARNVCPGFEIRDELKSTYNDIFHWAVMDYDGNLDPDKGLFLWGDVGTGKSTMLKIIREFCQYVRPPVDGRSYYFRIDNVIDICAEFADETRDGGYNAIRCYINCPRQAFDELGSETKPTGRWGNFENVMQYIFQRRYDSRDSQFTHVTSNYTPDQIAEYYGARIYDRFKEMFNFVALRGKTFRKSTQKNFKDETETKTKTNTKTKAKTATKTGAKPKKK